MAEGLSPQKIAAERRNVLALNCGSSSLKFAVYACHAAGAELVCDGMADEVGGDSARFWSRAAGGEKREEPGPIPDHRAALLRTAEALERHGLPEPDAVGHRLVHGGPKLREHRRLDPEIYKELQAAADFAPLHVPTALSVIDGVSKKMPGAPQVVCLDTAFHRHIPDVAMTFALPQHVRDMGVERYGFHGISLESIVAQLDPVPERLVVAHLGNGCSITAVRGGVSVDTSMGLTPTGGIMMGTRSGDLDPGIIVFLMRNGYSDAAKLEQMLDHECGLKGVSGESNDVRDLMRLAGQDGRAALAVRMFCYQSRKTIAAMAAALGGIDMLVFTGGIGEHVDQIREEICAGLRFLGDCQIRVLPAREDLQIALTTARLTV
ncbi:MAG: acetate/propionate family kinase [Acidobacteriaceae bacterium]|nr:acetate/propionate family kinase [Acidobacteriaceae bacterium]MBV8570551.1 acetate/propionate family kinase [Acidobacteriaceae bacterium]